MSYDLKAEQEKMLQRIAELGAERRNYAIDIVLGFMALELNEQPHPVSQEEWTAWIQKWRDAIIFKLEESDHIVRQQVGREAWENFTSHAKTCSDIKSDSL